MTTTKKPCKLSAFIYGQFRAEAKGITVRVSRDTRVGEYVVKEIMLQFTIIYN